MMRTLLVTVILCLASSFAFAADENSPMGPGQTPQHKTHKTNKHHHKMAKTHHKSEKLAEAQTHKGHDAHANEME